MFNRIIASLFCAQCVRCGCVSLGSLCPNCKKSPLYRTRTRKGLTVAALAFYDGGVGNMIRALKYDEETVWATKLGRALGQLYPDEWRTFRLVPVPLHPERLVERGYNQAALLAREISDHVGARCSTALVERSRKTEVQARLTPDQRTANTSGAFRAKPTAHPERLILVDDVVTTGSTAEACAQALRDAGHSVEGVVCVALAGELARTEPEDSERVSALVSLRRA